jgi:hypothetical protein
MKKSISNLEDEKTIVLEKYPGLDEVENGDILKCFN